MDIQQQRRVSPVVPRVTDDSQSVLPIHRVPAMTETATAVYTYVSGHADCTESQVATALGLSRTDMARNVHILRAHRLVRPSPARIRGWDLVGPDNALAELITDEEARLRREQAMLLRAREQILKLLPSYLSGLRNKAPDDAIDVVYGSNDVLLKHLIQRAQASGFAVWVADPGREATVVDWLPPNDPDSAAESASQDGRPGVRVVIDHVARQDPDTRRRLSSLSEQGDQVRTLNGVPIWLVVFDRSIAFLPAGHNGTEQGFAVVRHPSVVEPLCAMFELLWDSAQPFTADAPGAHHVGDVLRLDILRLLAAGMKDEVVARRLRLSVRTCRRHIAEVMRQLGAESRFQAGVLAEREIFREAGQATVSGHAHPASEAGFVGAQRGAGSFRPPR
jgi:hypothetical protein